MHTCSKCNINYLSSYQGSLPVCAPCRKYFIKDFVFEINYEQLAKGGNKLATLETKKMGANAEITFSETCKNNYRYKIRRSTKYEETRLHYDFVIEVFDKKEIKYFKIEVKSMKTRKRGKPVDPNIIYLEYKNVIGGPGWLYGKSDYIAFEQPNSFLMVLTSDLVKFANNKKDNLKISTKSGIINTLYSRRNRSDLIGCFSLEDILCNNNYFILNK